MFLGPQSFSRGSQLSSKHHILNYVFNFQYYAGYTQGKVNCSLFIFIIIIYLI